MAELPSGTMTFLFTDVEGSTALWEAAPEAMRVALARHDALFEAAVHERRGVHIRPRGEGDSRFAVFASAPDAVGAAVAIQRAFACEPWPTPRPVKVRMGLHTGEAEARDGDYYGATVNRCARLRGIGHGGQILVSEATAELARDALPAATDLRDLGEHRLKDLSRPERVFQILHSELPDEFPRLLSLELHPHNLPIEPTPLIGRERELGALRALMLDEQVRLITMTGPGGTGKTRLALQIAADLLDHFPDGVFFVPLAPISDTELAISTIAQVLGLQEIGGRSIRDILMDYLKEKHLLLVLDNFEHLLVAAPLVADLLAACARLKVLVTSRAVLHLRGEREYAVPALACPDPIRPPPVEGLSQYAAVALFVQRAADVKRDFSITDGNAPAVAEICRRVDGLPLGIELAAARVRLLTPQAMLERFERRLPLLTGGARDLPVRQRTLRDTIAWSYDLLDEAERRLLHRLSVFEGGLTLEAAEAVCTSAGRLNLDVLDGLEALVGKSLLRREEGLDGEGRFRMLETVREFALDRLRESGEMQRLEQEHTTYYLALAEQAPAALRGPRQLAWLGRLEHEHNNLRSALRRAVGRGRAGDAEATEQGLRLAAALWRFWYVRGHFAEGRRWLTQLLALPTAAMRTATRANALNGAGGLARPQGDYAAARGLHQECLAIRRELGDQHGIAGSLNNLGLVARYQGAYADARRLFEEAIDINRALGNPRGEAVNLNNLGNVLHDQGEYTVARVLQERSLILFRESGDEWGIAMSLCDLGNVVGELGDHAAAHALYDESLVKRRDVGDRRGMTMSLTGLGRLAYSRGDYAASRAQFNESLAISRDLGDRWGIVHVLEGFAALAAAEAQPERALCLASAAAALREVLDVPLWPADRVRLERWLEPARRALHETAQARAWDQGRAMTLEQAVAYALDEQPSA
jgi:predicted ATPase/class 3 adenylate cyclase